ncbi:homocysteine S-methyltransferase [Salinibacterium sp. ZJ450]|uniref:homocysteine S-methyltransferase n=1 Tax=Salinibacterium sp. ZJ450 TaxID=2708338 RepID=UPI001423583D|nr:homocysteine S-methyltransferase [Salinibacterium sp. ZJ450]
MTSLVDALAQGPVVLDGGLGTLLESEGHDLSSDLWSARLLVENPDAIRRAHEQFFAAGAQVAISSSYQVSFEGLARRGIGGADAERLLRLSVQLALDARPDGDRWVAASVGPYGAMRADGSEYRGDYGLTVDELRAWHRPRMRVLADSGADALAIETIPCLTEVEAVLAELHDTRHPGWLAVTAARGVLRSGESLAEAYALADAVDEVVAVGINCADPDDVAAAIDAARSVTAKRLVVYPNSGERWDAKNRAWLGDPGFSDAQVHDWIAAGARLVGGCCRVGPEQIRRIAALT